MAILCRSVKPKTTPFIAGAQRHLWLLGQAMQTTTPPQRWVALGMCYFELISRWQLPIPHHNKNRIVNCDINYINSFTYCMHWKVGSCPVEERQACLNAKFKVYVKMSSTVVPWDPLMWTITKNVWNLHYAQLVQPFSSPIKHTIRHLAKDTFSFITMTTSVRHLTAWSSSNQSKSDLNGHQG